MADMTKLIEKVVKKVGAKKSKVKPVKEVPKGTKAKKLPPDLQKGLEEKFSVDLKHVRVHTGKAAQEANKAMGARAFTHGTDLFLSRDSDASNKELLAHELVHVMQYHRGKKLPRDGKGKGLVSK